VPFAKFGAILSRQWWVVLTTVVVIAGGTAGIITSMPKQYTADATILIEPRRTQVSDLQAISADPGEVSSLIRTQIDILRSPALLAGVVIALHLDSDPDFVEPSDDLLSKATAQIHRILSPASKDTELNSSQKVLLAAAALGGKITFANELKSSVLRVMVTTKRAALSAAVANELAGQFLEFKRREKFQAMQRAHDWFQEQLEGLANQAREAEAALEQYRTQHGLIDLPDDGTSGAARTTTVARQQLSEVTSQLAQVSRERAQKEAKLSQAKAVTNGQVGHIGTLPDVLMSPGVLQLLNQETTVAAKEAQLAASEGSGNPELIAVRAQLNRIQARLTQEMSNIVQSLGNEVQAARGQEEILQRRVQQLREAVGSENVAEVGLQGLRAKARATRNIYDSFLTRATQLANVAGIQEPDASLVSRAEVPLNPSAPKPLRFIAVATLLSTVLGIGLACFIERLRRGFGTPEQIEGHLGIPCIAMLPSAPAKARVPGASGRRALKFAASLDKLRGHLLAQGDHRPKVVMISSALPEEGKSVLAASFAANAAAAGWRVLLIECDFRRPSTAKLFKLKAGPGLSEILVGGMLGETETALHEVSHRLHVIRAGRAKGDPQELLASARMNQLLTTARAKYDLVLLDTPPVIAVPDPLVLARYVDATILVVRWEKTQRAVVQDAVRALATNQAGSLDAVLSRADLRRAAQSSGRPATLYDYSATYRIART
jgi:capsular exopolysaccharide synthesis family protein